MIHFPGDERSDHARLLQEALGDARRPAPPELVRALATYLDEMALWARRGPLTGLRTAHDRVHVGVMDCVPLLEELGDRRTLLDVGSGNGLPGVVAALMRPGLQVTLVEPAARRAAFLRTVAHKTGASNLKVERARVQDLPLPDPLFEAAVSRAVFPPRRWLSMAVDLVRPGGAVFLMLGPDQPPRPPPALRAVTTRSYRPAGGVATRRLVYYEKTQAP